MGAMAGPLAAFEAGAGRPLVLLHGNGESHRVFDAMVPLLAPRRRLVGLDSRGHGASPRGSGPLTVGSMADDVDAALDALGLAGVDLLGFSDGGNVALELALRHPGRAGRLVVVGANLFPDGLKAGSLWPMRAVHAVLRRAAGIGPAWRAREERWALMTEQPRIDPASLARVDAPVLVVAGERDLVRDEHTRLIAAALPRAELAIVAGAGHLLPRTRPAELAALVDGFLARPEPS